jgi:hypothetical protein
MLRGPKFVNDTELIPKCAWGKVEMVRRLNEAANPTDTDQQHRAHAEKGNVA